MKNYKFLLAITLSFALVFSSCNIDTDQQKSDSGITKATTTGVKTDDQGHTADQRNIIERTERDNLPGSIKHLYIISSYTGDVLQYSTVNGKVTSGNKRLSPKTLNGSAGIGQTGISTNFVRLNNDSYVTDEVLDEGGTYGDSGNYMFWFDAQGNYQQYYPAGGTYVQISDKPLRIHKANLSLSLDMEPNEVSPKEMKELLNKPGDNSKLPTN